MPDLDDGGYNPNVPWAAGAIVSNVRDLSRFYAALLSGRLLSGASLATMKKSVAGIGLGIWPTELPCGGSWGHGGYIVDYQTLVTASEEGDRVAVVSLRGPGYIPPLGRALLCAEPPLAAGSSRAKSTIAFVSTPGPYPAPLYVVNADRSGQGWLRLTAAGPPAWSPDGRKIAFTSDRDGNPEVYLMNADGSGQRRLTRNAAPDSPLAWSPDGRKIAFASRREIYVINADGRGQRRLTHNAAVVFATTWSPDGRKIAFLSNRDGNSEIYVVNADGSGQRNLTRNPAGDSSFAWSPDRRRIAFRSKRDGSWEIYVMNADGSGPRRLTRNPAYDAGPTWSPDGRNIAFGSGRDGNSEIYVMNPDGSGQRNLTRSPWHESWPAWSPGRTK